MEVSIIYSLRLNPLGFVSVLQPPLTAVSGRLKLSRDVCSRVCFTKGDECLERAWFINVIKLGSNRQRVIISQSL